MSRRCAQCGTGFVPEKPHGRYCSDRCRRDHYAASEQARGRCIDCDELLGVRKGRGPAKPFQGRCADCYDAERLRKTAERGHQIEQWWEQGRTTVWIAEQLGWTTNHLGDEMNRLRRKGFNLPFRYRIRNGYRVPG